MSTNETGQVSHNAAEVYEQFFLPALFQQWADQVVDVAGIQPGQRVLDVACGTGVLARAAAARVGSRGRVVGVDINDGMLAVARKKAPEIEWRIARAEDLPFGDDQFDTVVSQFGLMFFTDRQAAIQEMVRVLRPGGRLAVAVWDSLERTPGYAAMVHLLQRLFSDSVAESLRSPYILGNPKDLKRLFSQAGLPDVQLATLPGTACFPSIEDWVYTDIKGWTLAEALNDQQVELLLREARTALHPFELPDGRVRFDSPAHIVTWGK